MYTMADKVLRRDFKFRIIVELGWFGGEEFRLLDINLFEVLDDSVWCGVQIAKFHINLGVEAI